MSNCFTFYCFHNQYTERKTKFYIDVLKENTKQIVTVPGNNYFQFPYKISTSHKEKKISYQL